MAESAVEVAAVAAPASKPRTKTAAAAAAAAEQAAVQEAAAKALNEMRCHLPNPDDIVVEPLTPTGMLPSQQYRISSRVGDGFTRLKSVGGYPVAIHSSKALAGLCGHYQIKGLSTASKLRCCEALIQWKEDLLASVSPSEEAAAGVAVGGNTANGKKKNNNKGDDVSKFHGNYLRLINCIMHPHPKLRLQYAKFYKQPTKDQLTKKLAANQPLYEEVMKMYNGDSEYDDPHAWDIDEMQAEHPDLQPTSKELPSNKSPPMPNWEAARSMIKTLHKEFNQAQIQWKTSGQHGDPVDVLAAMKESIIGSEETKEEDRFVMGKAKCLYYFLLMAEHGTDFFNAVAARLPEGMEANTLKPRAKRSSSSNGRARKKRSNNDSLADGMTELAGAHVTKANVQREVHRDKHTLQAVQVMQTQVDGQQLIVDKLSAQLAAKKARYRELYAAEKAAKQSNSMSFSQNSMLSTAETCREEYNVMKGELDAAKALLAADRAALASMLPSATALAKTTTTTELTPKRATPVAPSRVTNRKKTLARPRVIDVNSDTNSDNDNSDDGGGKPAAVSKPNGKLPTLWQASDSDDE
jgi:hypothetical protein